MQLILLAILTQWTLVQQVNEYGEYVDKYAATYLANGYLSDAYEYVPILVIAQVVDVGQKLVVFTILKRSIFPEYNPGKGCKTIFKMKYTDFRGTHEEKWKLKWKGNCLLMSKKQSNKFIEIFKDPFIKAKCVIIVRCKYCDVPAEYRFELTSDGFPAAIGGVK